MGNNPVSMIDPDGGFCTDSEGNMIPCPDGYSSFEGPSGIYVFDRWEDGTWSYNDPETTVVLYYSPQFTFDVNDIYYCEFELHQYVPNIWENMRDNGGFIGRFAYDSANGVYTTGQLLMFRSIGASEVVNLDRTITNSDEAFNGLISTTLLGAEYVQGIKMATSGLKTMSSSTQGWMKFNSEFRFRPDFNPSVHKMTLKGIEYKRMININNESIKASLHGVVSSSLLNTFNSLYKSLND